MVMWVDYMRLPDWWVIEYGEMPYAICDCIEGMKQMPDNSVHCVVTSPPYWGLRDYGTAKWEGGDEKCDHKPDKEWLSRNFTSSSSIGKAIEGNDAQFKAATARWYKSDGSCPKCGAIRIDHQIGLEQTPDEYVANMTEVFREVRRILREDGNLWLNLGDSYNGSGGAGGDYNKGGLKDGQPRYPGRNVGILKPKDLCGIPWRVAFALQADGWWLRSAIPWIKNSAMPESCTDRPSSAVEYFFLLTKSKKYFYDVDAVRIAPSNSTIERWKGDLRPHNPAHGDGTTTTNREQFLGINSSGRNRRNSDWFMDSLRSFWFMDSLRNFLNGENGTLIHDENDVPIAVFCNPKPFKGAHFASFSPDLILPMILAGTSAKGCCPGCGAPWERAAERTNISSYEYHKEKGLSNYSKAYGDDGGNQGLNYGGGHKNNIKECKTLGWQPTCTCPEHDPQPCIVFDPFLGSGTTAAVARMNGRIGLGMDLNPAYEPLIVNRTRANDKPLDHYFPNTQL